MNRYLFHLEYNHSIKEFVIFSSRGKSINITLELYLIIHL